MNKAFEEYSLNMENSTNLEQTETQSHSYFQEIKHNHSQSVNTVQDGQTIQEYSQLTEPNYWLFYEYQKISGEVNKLNEKIDLVLSIIRKKPRRNTISEVSTKVDCIIERLNKRIKLDSEKVDH